MNELRVLESIELLRQRVDTLERITCGINPLDAEPLQVNTDLLIPATMLGDIAARDRVASASQDIARKNTHNIQRAYMDRADLLRRLTKMHKLLMAAVQVIPNDHLSTRADILAQLTEIES